MNCPRRIRWTTLCAVALAACNDQPTAPLPDQLVVTRPSATVGAPGFPLMDTIFVRVLDAAGNGRVGVPVTWIVRDGGGSVFPLSETSGTDGTTAAIWTLGPKPGYNELRVSIGLGQESSHTFTATGEVFRASEVVGGYHIGCGLVEGAIWCWGLSSPLVGTPASSYDSAESMQPPFFSFYSSTGPALYDETRIYIDLAIETYGRICALDTQGTVWCSSQNNGLPLIEVAGFPALRRGSLVGSSRGGTCGLAEADGRAWCLKDGSVEMVPGSPFFSVLRLDETGGRYCGLQADSTAACWGTAPPGDGSSTPSPVPVTVSGGHRFVDLVVASYFACGRTAGGELWCWGRSYRSQPNWLEPMLTATNVTLAGATDYYLVIAGVGGSRSRGLGPDLAPELGDRPLEGLENVALAEFPEGGTYCLVGIEGEVYCIRETWKRGSDIDIYGYFPVMPVRQAPPAPAVLR